jgi:hypothetical protein
MIPSEKIRGANSVCSCNSWSLNNRQCGWYAPRNMDELWIDPHDYQDQLESAVEILSTRGMDVSIYNHQLCVLRTSLWKFARKSISDWKNIYLEDCDSCGVREHCGGFFQWARKVHSNCIHSLPPAEGANSTAEGAEIPTWVANPVRRRRRVPSLFSQILSLNAFQNCSGSKLPSWSKSISCADTFTLRSGRAAT